jgi:hypothetical protein
MAESVDQYLQECRAKDICPTCQKPLTNRVGSGNLVFCSLDCDVKWRAPDFIMRHFERLRQAQERNKGGGT